jgi:multisubunit Na+/H+ antiporter MnhE subunit
VASRASRAALAWILVAIALFAFWMLLVDTREAPQVYAGLAVAALGATGSELVRRQRVAGARLRVRWLARAYRPLLSVPRDLVRLGLVLRGTFANHWLAKAPRPAPGRFRALAFDPGSGGPDDVGREALAEIAGSFSPNTFVVGLDRERGLLLVHQLVPETERPQESIDPLELR